MLASRDTRERSNLNLKQAEKNNKIVTEIKEIENRKTIEKKINKTKIWLLKKIDELDKLLAVKQKKERRQNYQY